MKKLMIVILTVMFLSMMTVFASESGTRIGTVDMQKALQAVSAGKKAKAQLEKEYKAKKKDLDEEQSELQKLGEELKKQSLVLSEDAKEKKRADLQERVMKLQEKTMKSQNDIQKLERDLTEPLVVKIRELINDMASKKGYTIILERNENTVLYSQDKDDLTEEVIKVFDSKYPKG